MTTLSIILTILATLIIIEGLIISIFSNDVKKILKELIKNKFLIKRIGLIEIVIGAVLFILAIILRAP